MFLLKLYDSLGNELNIGDIVRVSDGKHFTFYTEVKYLEDQKEISPFHTFSFDRFEKVKAVPADAQIINEENFKIWYVVPHGKEPDIVSDGLRRYVLSWRQCEHHLETRCFRVEPLITLEFS